MKAPLPSLIDSTINVKDRYNVSIIKHQGDHLLLNSQIAWDSFIRKRRWRSKGWLSKKDKSGGFTTGWIYLPTQDEFLTSCLWMSTSSSSTRLYSLMNSIDCFSSEISFCSFYFIFLFWYPNVLTCKHPMYLSGNPLSSLIIVARS